MSREPMGRPRKIITDEHLRQIEALAGYGLTEAAIATVLDMDPATFRRKKADEARVMRALEKGKRVAESVIGQALYVKAKSGDLGAIVWWEKTRADRRETVKQEVIAEVRQVNVVELRERIAERLARLAASN